MTAAPLSIDFVFTGGTDRAASAAALAEERGVDGFLTHEIKHDPLIQLALAAQSTGRIDLATAVTIAFARTPMTLATSAYDVQRLSGGRLTIGLGSQIKPHITRRYGMEWSRPAARMREFAGALRAIWHSWETGDKLDFRGDFYTHTLMTPTFDPGPVASGPPRIWIAGVGPMMTAVAGQAADGLICHAFTTTDYLRQVTLPALGAARAKAEADGERRAGLPLDVVCTSLVATGRTEEEYEASLTTVRERIAFYASTPAYRAVLDLHGWGELHESLHRLSTEGRWQEMGLLIEDDVLNTFAVTGEPAVAGRELRKRFDGLCTRVTCSVDNDPDGTLALDVLEAARSLTPA
ncbi:TIGR03617 family F420-dependent LLM class oxidoreductase [Streptomyces sp. NPDC051018]|uniref:TIGR03617 family F420-dependent LLM class oxidoreductase n=1 Tax=Streptomyces sp. NPDC051018 TaxID=3365639 RepID=UPI0037B9EAE1